jgi:hypothetical protein
MKLASVLSGRAQVFPMSEVNHPLPNGFTASHSHVESIASRLRASFSDSPYQELRCLACDCSDGELTIRGRVPSFYLKQLAVCLVKQVDGDIPIRIAIEVS